MQSWILYLHRAIVLFALTFALVATGFAHRVTTSDDLAMQAYVLAGGDLGDLCLDANGDGLPDHRDCPACHIVASGDLPSATGALRDADLVFVAKVVAPRESRAVRAVLNSAHRLRAPPVA